MSRIYSDPARESDTYALPDVAELAQEALSAVVDDAADGT